MTLHRLVIVRARRAAAWNEITAIMAAAREPGLTLAQARRVDELTGEIVFLNQLIRDQLAWLAGCTPQPLKIILKSE